jgi:carbamoyltransferase
MRILGISIYHDSAAALVEDGRIVAAAEEERFTRKKNDGCFPSQALLYCLREGRIGFQDIDHVVYFEKPFLKFERLIETYLSLAPCGFRSFCTLMPIWLREKLFQKKWIADKLRALGAGKDISSKLLFSGNHQSFAAAAFFPSPFEEAVVLTMNGVGEWSTTVLSIGRDNKLDAIKEIHFPHSLGLLYGAFTYFCGFKINSEEGKLMSLSPYGEPKYRKLILDTMVDLKDDGSFRLDMSYFNYCTGLTMTSPKFDALFGMPPRKPDEPLTPKHIDLAASIQAVLEEIVLRITRTAAKETGLSNLCLAGGVAFNNLANGKIIKDGAFKNVWIQPAAGGSGSALGAALAGYYIHGNQPRQPTPFNQMQEAYLGPSFSEEEIEKYLARAGANFEIMGNIGELSERVAALLAEGSVVAWFQERMEFGPRSGGHRSIYGDARDPQMPDKINAKVKFRDKFQPYGMTMLREKMTEWFDVGVPNLDTVPAHGYPSYVRPEHRLKISKEEEKRVGFDKIGVRRSTIPAITHVDYSVLLHLLDKETNPRAHALVSAFYKRTGFPILVHTSFNIGTEPIVCTPEEAFLCFMASGIDALAIGNCLLIKDRQNPSA